MPHHEVQGAGVPQPPLRSGRREVISRFRRELTTSAPAGERAPPPGHSPRFPAKRRQGPGAGQNFQRARFSPAHRAFLRRHQIIMPGEVQPAVHQIQRELAGEIAALGPGEVPCGVHGYTDFAAEILRGVARERDHVGGRRISEKLGVQLRQFRIAQENQGELAGKRCCAGWGQPPTVRIQSLNRQDDGRPVQLEFRVTVRDRHPARGRRLPVEQWRSGNRRFPVRGARFHDGTKSRVAAAYACAPVAGAGLAV
jgi:hypothetical protein